MLASVADECLNGETLTSIDGHTRYKEHKCAHLICDFLRLQLECLAPGCDMGPQTAPPRAPDSSRR